ncbi:MAG: type II methionyl aminopeptidase [Candidatus Helarchaeota archaeon]
MTENEKKDVEESAEEKEEKSEEEELAEKLEYHRLAGSISKEIEPLARSLVKVGANLIDICSQIEEKILEKTGTKGGMAFPCNISLNNIAAHYSSPPGDQTVIKEGDLVKVDYGIHMDGYISDFAFSVSFNPEYDKMVEVASKAVKAVIAAVKPGVKSNELGAIAEKIAKENGYRTIIDLSGHLLEKWELHGKKIIPNFSTPSGTKLEENEVYAMETFITTGSGNIHDMNTCYIYQLLPIRRFPRSAPARKILKIIGNKYKTLPFAKRWLAKEVGFGYNLGLRELVRLRALHEFHPLAEDKRDAVIAQREVSFIVTKDGAEVFNWEFDDI